MKLVVNGSFYNTPISSIGGVPVEGDVEVYGYVLDLASGTCEFNYSLGHEQSAFLAQGGNGSRAGHTGLGNPPSECSTGIGSLVPLILGNKFLLAPPRRGD